MPPDGWFRRKSKFPPAPAAEGAAAVPEGVATKCAQLQPDFVHQGL